MNEQELTKWKNKYRLWKVLHPKENEDCCRDCIHVPKAPKHECPWLKSELCLTAGFDKNDKMTVKLKTQNNHDSFHCIEWMRYVP